MRAKLAIFGVAALLLTGCVAAGGPSASLSAGTLESAPASVAEGPPDPAIMAVLDSAAVLPVPEERPEIVQGFATAPAETAVAAAISSQTLMPDTPASPVARQPTLPAPVQASVRARVQQAAAFPPPPPGYAAANETPEILMASASPATPIKPAPPAEIMEERSEAPVPASNRERDCLMRAMYFESRRNSPEGLLAVGTVVMNRVAHGSWGKSICGVVGAKRQFAPGVMTRRMQGNLSDLQALADRIIAGKRHPKITSKVMFFHVAGMKFPYKNMRYVHVAGGNTFYYKAERKRRRG
jgi:spore germination cell wall hydrolase CwlJ-like protein